MPIVRERGLFKADDGGNFNTVLGLIHKSASTKMDQNEI